MAREEIKATEKGEEGLPGGASVVSDGHRWRWFQAAVRLLPFSAFFSIFLFFFSFGLQTILPPFLFFFFLFFRSSASSASLVLFFNEQCMKRRRFGQNTSFHLKEKGGKNLCQSPN
jgi:hypothetical protein